MSLAATRFRLTHSFSIPSSLRVTRSSLSGTQLEFKRGSNLTALDNRIGLKTGSGITGLTFKFLLPACVYCVLARVYIYLEINDGMLLSSDLQHIIFRHVIRESVLAEHN